MKIQKFEQTTFETCLAVSLLNLLGAKISQSKERAMLDFALDFSKESFTVGHLEYAVKRYNVTLDWYVDNARFASYLRKIRFSKNITLRSKKIDVPLVDRCIQTSPVIVYLDAYNLWGVSHYPHFVIVIEKLKKAYKIFDPWDGKIKPIKLSLLSKAINSLKNHLNFTPQLVQISDS